METSSPSEAPIDRYVVLEYLAEGGMGAIYLGKKMGAGGFEKQVVLKQLLPEFTRQPEFIDLFLREARLSATLDHANIIHTIDLVTAGEDYFIVMEYLDGADLRTLLRRCKKKRRGLSPAAGIYVARELLSALAYAHNKVGPDGVPLRLIHRDISPSNILISGSGEVKLTDFGIAKASTHNSVFYRVKGKVGYMSPEQAKSEHLDARSDLYSLAVCLFEIITGERLFVNVGLTTSADEMYAQPVPLISHKMPGLPPELDKVMLKALSRDPDHRYQTAGEFQEALLRCAHRHGLMMSAPDLAEHLSVECGDPASWRDESGETGGIGTELYEMDDEEEPPLEPESTDRIDPDEVRMGGRTGLESDSDMSVALASGGQLLRDRDSRRRRARTSITKLTELRGIALTSMINLAGGTSTDHAGADPLIDFDDLGRSPMLPSTTDDAGPAGPMPGAAQPGRLPATMRGMQPGMQQPGMQPGVGPGMQPGVGPGMQPGMRPGMQPGMQPGMGPGMQPGMGPGMQPGMQPGMGPGMQPGMQPGMGPGMQPGMGPGMQPGMQPGMGPGMQPGMGPGGQPGMSSGMQPGMRPGMSQGMRPGMAPPMGAPGAYPPHAGAMPGHPGAQPHPQTGPHARAQVAPAQGGPHAQPQGKPHPLAPPGVHPQAPRGSLADIDPLEQTGIVVEPALSAMAPQGSAYPPSPGPGGFGESGPMQAIPTFMPQGHSASMPVGGRSPGSGVYAQTWAAALTPVQRPWLLLAIIFLVGVGTAAVIGLSGPTIHAATSPVPLAATPTAVSVSAPAAAPARAAGPTEKKGAP
ncbi:MAG TPA: protein kinase [Kofleriaceae bacterium]|nr:protein kinase [Kofleriaceae bacterium]